MPHTAAHRSPQNTPLSQLHTKWDAYSQPKLRLQAIFFSRLSANTKFLLWFIHLLDYFKQWCTQGCKAHLSDYHNTILYISACPAVRDSTLCFHCELQSSVFISIWYFNFLPSIYYEQVQYKTQKSEEKVSNHVHNKFAQKSILMLLKDSRSFVGRIL